MRYRITHRTEYRSVEAVSVGHNEAWLTPRNTPTQRCLNHQIEVSPGPSIIMTRTDYFQNTTTQFAFNQGYHELVVTSVNDVEVLAPIPAETLEPTWESVRDTVRAHETEEDFTALEFVFNSPRCRVNAEFAEYAMSSFPPGGLIRECIADLMKRFHDDFQYDSTATTVSTPVEQVFRIRRGVCQDFAHLLISMLRSIGIPARYVSGYLRTLPPPGKPRLVGADASHAWMSVYCGAWGWIDIDPTNNQFTSTDHITIAWGRDYTDVAPLKGVYIGGSSPQLLVSVDVAEVAPAA
ncbi:MAG: transglutaminase family protein [Planctomycetota bacterium]|nr:MAG: transglutaminase family protein [Planctomycetota bacterium]